MTRHRWILAATTSLCLVLALWLSGQTGTHVVLVHTNDLHGQLLPRNGVGGFAEIATLVRNIQPDLVIDAGDMFTGTFLSDDFKGVPIIAAMNAIGVHAAALGNHEFDYGQNELQSRVREARFPFLSANVKAPASDIRKYTILTAKGIRFGVIGLTTADLATTTHPRHLKGVEVMDVVTAMRGILPEVRKQSDVVIIAAHVTDVEERRIAAAFPEIPLIVGGHNHSTTTAVDINRTKVVKTGSSGRNVGRVDLYFEGKSLRRVESQVVPVSGITPARDVADVIAPFRTKVAERMSVVVGHASAELTNSSTGESPLANLVADAMRAAVKTDIAIQNTGGIRTRVPQGPVTWGTVFEILPFNNTIITMRLTGAQLKRILATRLLAVSGVRVQLNLTAPSGRRLAAVTLSDGNPVVDSRSYSVATNDFLVAGGDGVSEFTRASEIKDTGILLHNAFVDFINARGTLTPELDGRVRIVQ
jgi:2',3'-cyclic-nucleotide 2'-phosphodiesterase (5'-nucleotidase family)